MAGTPVKSESKSLLLHEKDNTVTALQDLTKGEEITVDPDVRTGGIVLREHIQYAHKFARTFIPKGTDVLKYGEVIGVSTVDIHPGEHVHVHNVESYRARGKTQ